MNKSALISAFFVAFAISSANSDEIKMCLDGNGNRYFTDIACDDNLMPEKRIIHEDEPTPTYGSPSPEYYNSQQVPYYADNPDPNAELLREYREKKQRRYEERMEARRKASKQPTWGERKAAENAEKSVRWERDMYQNRKSGPRDAAEYAIEYNAKSFAGGGSHQVRVPDVTNIHIHSARNPRNGHRLTPSGSGMIDPSTGEYFSKSGRGYVGVRTGDYVPAP